MNFLNLPIDVFYIIADKLDPLSIYNLLHTKKCFRTLINDELFTKTFLNKYYSKIRFSYFQVKYGNLIKLMSRESAIHRKDKKFCLDCDKPFTDIKWYTVFCSCMGVDDGNYHEKCIEKLDKFEEEDTQPSNEYFELCYCPSCGNKRLCVKVTIWSF